MSASDKLLACLQARAALLGKQLLVSGTTMGLVDQDGTTRRITTTDQLQNALLAAEFGEVRP